MRVSSTRQGSRRATFILSRIFPLIFVAVGVIATYFGGRGLVRANASQDWPTTQGKIVASAMESHRSSGSNGASSTTYHAEILYEFSVDDTTLNGNRVAYGDYGSSDPSHARRIVNRYPVGKIVSVRYLPGNPEECLLEPGMKAQSLFFPGFGLLFLAVGILMAVYLPKAKFSQ